MNVSRKNVNNNTQVKILSITASAAASAILLQNVMVQYKIHNNLQQQITLFDQYNARSYRQQRQ